MLVSNNGLRDNIDYTVAQQTLNLLTEKDLNLGKSEIISSLNKNKEDDSNIRILFTFKKLLNELEGKIRFFEETSDNTTARQAINNPFGFTKFSFIIESFKNFIDYFKTNILQTYLTTSNQIFKDEVLKSFNNLNQLLNNIADVFVKTVNKIENSGFVFNNLPRSSIKVFDEAVLFFDKMINTLSNIIEVLNNNNLKRLNQIPQDLDKILNEFIFNIVK